ncbi:MAG: hypothetical protein GAK31_00858 [Stenotrophomonas maltophilia]|uniref:Flagellar basal body rod protein N-terminal domain-containing protein n=1 Tax=Stenotrophomonas maltophilia TaxID=40324 RepID=A0A7V8JNL6_STEMA|nr:MAG: hypothetical protein GAK31_00858 [Stenotrophomonas maltophilia]
MNAVMAMAGSVLRVAQQGVQVAAHNVANVANLATPEAQRLQLQRSTSAQGGVEATVGTAGPDPAAPLGDLLAAKAGVAAFAANAALIRRQDQMLGTLLDRKA